MSRPLTPGPLPFGRGEGESQSDYGAGQPFRFNRAPERQARERECNRVAMVRSAFLDLMEMCSPNSRKIPKGFRPPAQGCEARATLGIPGPTFTTPKGLRPRVPWTHRKHSCTGG